MAKSPEEVKLWREQQKLDGTNAMAEYKEAEGSARDRLARLRTERATREATRRPPLHQGDSPPTTKTQTSKTKKPAR